MVGQKFRMKQAFAGLEVGAIVIVAKWDNASRSVGVRDPAGKGSYTIRKYWIEPVQSHIPGMAPYGVGLKEWEERVGQGDKDLEALRGTESQYKKNPQIFAR